MTIHEYLKYVEYLKLGTMDQEGVGHLEPTFFGQWARRVLVTCNQHFLDNTAGVCWGMGQEGAGTSSLPSNIFWTNININGYIIIQQIPKSANIVIIFEEKSQKWTRNVVNITYIIKINISYNLSQINHYSFIKLA